MKFHAAHQTSIKIEIIGTHGNVKKHQCSTQDKSKGMKAEHADQVNW